jgi:putative heme-binding domain-containing protein
VPALLVKAWPGAPDAVRQELIEALLAQPERTLLLLTEMETERIKADTLGTFRRVQLVNHRRSDVRTRSGALFAKFATPKRKEVLDKYRPALKMTGDARRGRDVFQKATCIACHKIGNLGVAVGPDISDTHTKTPEALLVDILDPNAAIDANFINYVVTLKNGTTKTGLIASETASSLTLRRGDNQTEVVLRQDIETDGVLSTGTSLMPEDLEKNMSVQDMADLLEFLRSWRQVEPAKK